MAISLSENRGPEFRGTAKGLKGLIFCGLVANFTQKRKHGVCKMTLIYGCCSVFLCHFDHTSLWCPHTVQILDSIKIEWSAWANQCTQWSVSVWSLCREWYLNGNYLVVIVSVAVILPLALMKQLGKCGIDPFEVWVMVKLFLCQSKLLNQHLVLDKNKLCCEVIWSAQSWHVGKFWGLLWRTEFDRRVCLLGRHAAFFVTVVSVIRNIPVCLCSRVPGIHQWFLPQLHGVLPHLGTSHICIMV